MPNKELKKEDYWRIAEEITEKIKKWPEWKRNISLLDEEDVEKLTKESKSMSEKKETIDERYEHITRRLNEIDSDKQGFLFSLAIKALLDDLMTEREKLKGRIEELTETIRERERYISTITS